MIVTRRGRLEETRQRKRLTIAILGSIAFLLFLILFGFKILIGFSVLVDSVRGTPAQVKQKSQARIFPPILDPLPIATKSGSLRISGSGQPNLTVTIYVDNSEAKQTIVAGNGNFFTTVSVLKEGTHVIQAKLSDNSGSESALTEGIHITLKSTPPILEITAPDENASVTGEKNTIRVEGKTEDDTTVSINGRFVVVRTDDSFSYDFPLNEGDNLLTIEARDPAGNVTRAERGVTYHK